jgi:hypothetical protein
MWRLLLSIKPTTKLIAYLSEVLMLWLRGRTQDDKRKTPGSSLAREHSKRETVLVVKSTLQLHY